MTVRRFDRLALAGALVLALGGCANTRPVGARIDDKTVQMRVERGLMADADTSRFHVDVNVVDGTAFLNGQVKSSDEKMAAGEVAANTIGVREVKNQLQVEGLVPKGGADDSSDLGIRMSVGTRLAVEPDVRRYQIDVDVTNGVVYLSGIVPSERAKMSADRVASSVDGVRRVQNNLKIAGEPEQPDDATGASTSPDDDD